MLEADIGLFLCALAVAAGAFLQGISGVGFALLAAPLVAIVHPELVPGPMLVLGGTIAALTAIREYRQIDYRSVSVAVPARIAGAIAAGLVIGHLTRATFGLLFAILILASVAFSLTTWRVRATPATLATAGFASGFMGTITSVGTPPMGIVLQNVEPARLRATVGLFLVAGTAASIAVLAWVGKFGWRDLALSVALIVPLAIGFSLSSPIANRLQPQTVRRFVLSVAGIAGLVLLVQNT